MSTALIDRFDQVLLDLDGVVYRGRTAVDGAIAAIEQLRTRRIATTFITNNASRPPSAVVEALAHVGVRASVSEVVTSATATATFIAETTERGETVLAVGGSGLHQALHERGISVVASADDHPAAVVVGFGADVGWRELAEACIAVQQGARLVATNPDITVPSERGLVPGNGALLGVVTAVTGAAPTIIGKPNPDMYSLALAADVPRERSIAVGDRLDTDIAGANRAGIASLFVLSGAHTIRDVVFAPPEARPTHIGRSVSDLLYDHPQIAAGERRYTCGDAQAAADSQTLTVRGGGILEQLAAGVSALWAAIDGNEFLPGSAHVSTLENLVHNSLD